jgi:ClpP class serine protease
LRITIFIASLAQPKNPQLMLNERLSYYKELEKARKSKLLVYITGDRPGMQTMIASDVLSIFTNHLDSTGDVDKISLFLYTRGGNTLTAWTLVNLIRNFCKELEVIIPFNCHSAGTLIALGANQIVMTKQATLGPIDPSVNGPLNPQVPGNNPNNRVPVSVEFVNAYLEMAKNELKIGDQQSLTSILLNLSNQIHPLTLGQVYRSKTQIQMLAKRLLNYQKIDDDKRDEIIKFLSSESGSHDYTLHRKEAADMGLHIEKPTQELYNIIKAIYVDIEKELELNTPFDHNLVLGTAASKSYECRRCLIESIEGGCDAYITKGNLTRQNNPGNPNVQQILDTKTFEGWAHVS